eukprot:COSAG04_NODE_19221_length_421_cov_1.068323_1_plen_44_part_10
METYAGGFHEGQPVRIKHGVLASLHRRGKALGFYTWPKRDGQSF